MSTSATPHGAVPVGSLVSCSLTMLKLLITKLKMLMAHQSFLVIL